MPDYQTLLDACHKPFKWYEHEMLQGKFIYVRVQDTVLRLNSLGVPWSFEQATVTFTEKFAHTHGQLTIEGLGTRGAPGAAALHGDADNAAKAAHSFALRKAGSLFGLSHYLMVRPQENTAFCKFMQTADLDNITDAKKAITLMAKCDGVSTVDGILKRYDIMKESLSSVEHIKSIIEREGRM